MRIKYDDPTFENCLYKNQCDKPYGGWDSCKILLPLPSFDDIIVGEQQEVGDDDGLISNLGDNFVWRMGEFSECLTLDVCFGVSGDSAEVGFAPSGILGLDVIAFSKGLPIFVVL